MTVNASRYEYPYDALHRRVIEYKYVDYGSQLPQDPEVARVDLYYSNRWQVIEDQSEHSGLNSADSVATVNAYVWSPGYVDDLVLRDRKVTIIEGENGSEEQERLYAQHDHNFNVTSLVSADSSATVEQRFVYDPYGAVAAYTSNYQPSTNNYSWVYLHQGGRQNEINGLYSFRYRELNANLGRWMQQDPAGYVDGSSLYQAVLSSPVNYVDPAGLYGSPHHFFITLLAGLRAGLTYQEAWAAALRAVMIDFDPGSQSPDASQANKHGMAGLVPNKPSETGVPGPVRPQTPEEAKEATDRIIKDQMEKAINNRDPESLGNAAHTVQDTFAPGHQGYQFWPGGFPTLQHIIGDWFPSWQSLVRAYEATLKLMQQYQSR